MDFLTSPHDSFVIPYVLANTAVVAGYFVMAGLLYLANYRTHYAITYWSAMIFLITGGLHHLQDAINVGISPDKRLRDTAETWLTLLVDIPHAISIGAVIIGISLDICWVIGYIEERSDRDR
jgi:hypothetical protein